MKKALADFRSKINRLTKDKEGKLIYSSLKIEFTEAAGK